MRDQALGAVFSWRPREGSIGFGFLGRWKHPSTSELATIAVFVALTGILVYILPRGHGFVQRAPLWIWPVFALISLAGAFKSAEMIPGWISGWLIVALGARWALDLREWMPEDVFAIKSIQRTLAYFFPFLGIYMILSGARVRALAGAWIVPIVRGLVISSLLFLVVSFLGWRWLEQPHYFFAVGLLGLAAVERLAVERRRDPANRNIGLASLPIAFLMGPGLGTCRSALIAGVGGFALYWLQAMVAAPAHWLRLALTLFAFAGGLAYHSKVDRYSAGLRLLESSRVLSQESGTFLNLLTQEGWSQHRVEESGPDPLLLAARPENMTQQRRLEIPFVARRVEAQERKSREEDRLLRSGFAATEPLGSIAAKGMRSPSVPAAALAEIEASLFDSIPGIGPELAIASSIRGELPAGLVDLADFPPEQYATIGRSAAHALARAERKNSLAAIELPQEREVRPWSWVRVFDPASVPSRSSITRSKALTPLFSPDRCALSRDFLRLPPIKRNVGVYFKHNAILNRLNDQVDTLAGTSNLLWRLLVWRDGISELMAAPLLGIGFASSFNSPSVAKLLPDIMDNSSNVDLHNSWLQVFVRGGLFVGLPWLVFWFFAFRNLGPVFRPVLVLWFIFSLPMVSFESPHLAIPVYLMLGLFALIGTRLEPGHPASESR